MLLVPQAPKKLFTHVGDLKLITVQIEVDAIESYKLLK